MTAFEIVGHSYAVPLGVPTAKGAMQLLAAHLGLEPANHAVTGAVLYSSKVSGGYATAANALVRNSATYERAVDHGGVWYCGNDVFDMGNPFGTSSQQHLKSSLRFAISRMCAGKIFDDEDPTITYSGFTKSTELGEGKVTGKYTHYATVNGSNVTISVPANFPGGDIGLYFNALNGASADWQIKVDGVVAGELTAGFNYGLANVYSMFCDRRTGLALGPHTIECIANNITTFAAFDSWAIEAVEPPTVIVPGQYTLQEYSAGETHTPTDADIEALEKLIEEVCKEFGSYVKFVSLASMNKTTDVQADKVHPTEAGQQRIYELTLAVLEAGEEGEAITGAHMDFGFMRDEDRRLIVAPGGEGQMDQGFVRDDERALAVAVGAEGTMDYGFVRDEDRRLVVVEGDIDHVDQGLPRDAEGRLVVATGEGDHFDQGFLRDAEGRVVVVGLS